MVFRDDEYNVIKQYLLGQLAGEERDEFERRYFADDDLYEQLLAGEDELVDEFLTNDLSEQEVVMFHQNFLVGTERRQKLQSGKAMRAYAQAHGGKARPKAHSTPRWQWSQSFSSVPVRIAAFAVIAIVAAMGVWRIFFFQSDTEKGLVALNAAYREQRPVEARITELNYAPFVTTRGEPPRSNSFELDRAERLLLDAVREQPSAASRHALGTFYLTQREFDNAISWFNEALNADPNNANVYADLGATLLEKARDEREQNPRTRQEAGKAFEYLAGSLRNLNRALELNGDLLGALFNRASVHELMALLPQAEDDLRKYLEKDKTSPWADEARQKLNLIEEERKKTSRTDHDIFQNFLDQTESDEEAAWSTISNYHNRTGNVVVERLVDQYLNKAAKNNEAAQAIQLLSYVGDVQARKGADRYFADVARFYRSATPEQRDTARAARELMKKSHAGWGRFDVKENLNLFQQAKELFERAGNFPESRFAEYWISFCHFRQHDQELSRQVLDRSLLLVRKRGYVWLQSRGLYLLSAIQFDLNEHSKAVDFALQSIALSEQINDSVGLLNASGALIEYYRYLGNYARSLEFIERSLSLLSSKPLDSIQRTRHYGVVALALSTIGLFDAAASYQQEALRLAINTGSPSAKASSYSFMGMLNGKLKNVTEALKHAQLGFDLAVTQSNEPAGRGLMAFAALQMGNVHRDSGNFDKAIPYYTQSIELYQTFPNFQTHLYHAHKGRLSSYLHKQNDALARREISIILQLLEKYRDKITGENVRNTFFDVEDRVVDAVIDFEYSRMKNPEQAFSYLNSAQARSLFDLLNTDKDVKAKVQDADIKFETVSRPRSLEEIKRHLPEQVQLLQYAVLEDKLIIFVLSRHDFQVKETKISRKVLNETVRSYLDIVSRPPDEDAAKETQLAKELYSALVQPVESLLNQEKLICIIPDGTLSYLPFPALISSSGRYFFEEHLLMTSPSASVFLLCTENATRKAKNVEERILSVGNPRFDRTAFPNLQDLPAAAKEATEIKSQYQSGISLIEEEATAAAVTSEIAKAQVIHLAGHSSIDNDVPLRSKLLLANVRRNAAHHASSSALYSFEIYNLKLNSTRLVVLSSCQSGAERYYGGEGMTSLARAFIGAGVPLVVASLWPVDSAATKELMVSFHKHRRDGSTSTVQALREAQKDMLRNRSERFRRPYYWAAFAVNGGYAEF